MRKYDLICKALRDLGVTVGAPKEVVAKKTGDKLSVLNFKLESEGVSGSIWLKLETAKPAKAPLIDPTVAPAAVTPAIDPNLMAAFAAFMAAQAPAAVPVVKKATKKAAA